MEQRLILCLLLSVSIILVQCKSCSREAKCKGTKVHGLKVADCYRREFKHFPQCIADSTQVIDLSYNRIRKIKKGDLSQYTSLQILYLSDNMVSTISEEAFDGQNDLQTLDLSMNSLQKVPPVIFHLPSLKNLYLGQNLNINIADTIENAKPISSPLAYLDIGFMTDEEAIQMPDLGIMPDLIRFNISGNVFQDVNTAQFAGLCNLKTLNNYNVTASFTTDCDCWILNEWLRERKVDFKQFECPVSKLACEDEELSPGHLRLYESCREKIKQLELKANVKKISIISGSCAIFVLIIIAIFVYRRRYRRPKPAFPLIERKF